MTTIRIFHPRSSGVPPDDIDLPPLLQQIAVLVERHQPDINHDRRSQENQAMLWGDRLEGLDQAAAISAQNPSATG
ncbi:MAG: hypothetical protein E5Y31_14890 [Mesorhizobium sp.]|nr:MAG: hypothetical protein E5Y31_14890 [Mesorhizobium sp.]